MPATFDLTHEQLNEFEETGVVRLRGFYPRADIDAMADRLWADLEQRYGTRRGRPESWGVAFPAQFQALKQSGAFHAFGSPALMRLADRMLGAGNWEKPSSWGKPLVTFPTAEPVRENPGWHLDVGGAERLNPQSTLRVFTFLEPVLPRGGGTLYIAGSHLLAIELERRHGGTVRSKQVVDFLRAEHPWFERVLGTPLSDIRPIIGVEADVGAHRVRLEEMTGDAGDLVIMHIGMLHGVAHNAFDRPRLMLTEWLTGSRKMDSK
jgi:hypothetical protein